MSRKKIHEVIDRECKKCKQVKDIESFPLHKTCKDGRSPVCRSCKTNYSRATRYGIKEEDYDAMLKKQEGKCAICGTKDPKTNGGNGRYGSFCVDHCHKTGGVRGLLCMACNIGIGKMKDDISILENAILYLKKSMK